MAQGGRSPDVLATLAVRVTPRASRDRIGPWRNGRLEVRTTAPPVEGQANVAVLRQIAEALGVATGRVRIVRGRAGREKLVQVEGLQTEEARRRLGA